MSQKQEKKGLLNNRKSGGRKKKYNKKKALTLGMDYSGFVGDLPEEIQSGMQEAIVVALAVLHGDGQNEGVSKGVIANLQEAEDIGKGVALEALRVMDLVAERMDIDDTVKLLTGLVVTQEIAEIANTALDADIDAEQVPKIYKSAVKAYFIAEIRTQPDQQSKEAKAIEIQKKVDPLLQAQQGQQGLTVPPGA